MNEKLTKIMKELVESADSQALASKEGLEAALKSKGCTPEEIKSVVDNFPGFPLDDDDLMQITGGGTIFHGAMQDPAGYR